MTQQERHSLKPAVVGSRHSLFTFASRLRSRLRSQLSARTLATYATAINSFRRFLSGGDIALECITASLLKSYQAHLLASGCSLNTVSFYMRKLRAIYNRAVDSRLIADRKPFRGVFTGMEKTSKRALPCSDITSLRLADLSHKPKMQFARDMFLLSFYLRGISFVDMAFLRRADLCGGIITYRRHKTHQRLSIRWTERMQQILDRYPSNTSGFLLPLITGDEGDLRKAYINAGQRINYHLKRLGKLLRLSSKVTMYCSRHSWATIARDKGIALSVISEGLGHESERTTRIYLDSLSASKVDKANDIVSNAV